MITLYRLLLVLVGWSLTIDNNNNVFVFGTNIAVIGGGISGNFFTKYITDYDINCTIESITIFEPYPVTSTIKKGKKKNDHIEEDEEGKEHQKSRIATLELDDGTIVEVGAGVLYKGFYLVSDIIRDGKLETAPPFYSGKEEEEENLHTGMGIYEGNGIWSLLTSNTPIYLRKIQLLIRYNIDLIRYNKVAIQAFQKFGLIPSMLESTNTDAFFNSPADIWNAIGLSDAVHNSFDTLLDNIGISKSISTLPWWRKYLLPYQGSIRSELLTAVNLLNYNQDNANVNGIVGLGSSLVAITGGLYTVKGGNYQIVQSAYQQAIQQRDKNCIKQSSSSSSSSSRRNNNTIKLIQKRITTVIGNLQGLALFANDNENLGVYDIVILAVPLQQSKIQFFVQQQQQSTTFDDDNTATIQPMPLVAGLINAHSKAYYHYGSNNNNNNNEKLHYNYEGHNSVQQLHEKNAPESASRPYKQHVTTVVSHGVLNTTYFKLNNNNYQCPRTVMLSTLGKAYTYNISLITQVTSSTGIYKIKSDDILSINIIHELFGSDCIIEYIAKWGGRYGGAIPDYQGQGTSTNFLLYDGSTGTSTTGFSDGHNGNNTTAGLSGSSNGLLYYPVAMEQCSLASLEIAAIGAKAVAKLVAKRINLIVEKRSSSSSSMENINHDHEL